MLPVLELAADGEVHRYRDAVEMLAGRFGLSDAERGELLPSGAQPVFDNRVGWAKTYLKQAGLIAAPRRGFFQITDAGRNLLTEGLREISVEVLKRYPAFLEFKSRRRKRKNPTAAEEVESSEPQATPDDRLAAAYQTLRAEVETDLLDQIMDLSPTFFERLVVDLLVRMGYGGNREDAGRAIGQTNDGGIDGIINEDRLGLDVVYIQAKRWEGTVGRPEVQKFAGALQGKRARKGVFITTSSFTKGAAEFAEMIESRIVLIDGTRLGRLMFDHGVGVSTAGMYEVKRIDFDYFTEDG